jgi:hypothetical protein
LIPRDYKYPEVPSGQFWKRDPERHAGHRRCRPGRERRAVRVSRRHARFDDRDRDRLQGRRDRGGDALVEAFIEDGTVRQYHVKLKPATAAFPKPARAAITVHRWGPGPDNTRCAYLEDPTNPLHTSIFVVDRLDRDCDGLEAPEDETNPLECLDDVHLGTIRPERVSTRCLTTDLIPNAAGDQTCVLGGPGCVDGRGKVADSCDPSTTCAPPQSCVVCKDRDDALDCMANSTATATTASRIDCTISTKLDTGGRFVCSGDATLTTRFQFLPMCRTDGPYLFWATGKNMWGPSITSAGLTLTPTPPTNDCGMTSRSRARSQT